MTTTEPAMTTTEAAVVITLRPGTPHEVLLAEAEQELADAMEDVRLRTPRRTMGDPDWVHGYEDQLPQRLQNDPRVVGAQEDVRRLRFRPVCRDHQNVDIRWLGVDPSVACCDTSMSAGVADGSLIIENPEVLVEVGEDLRYSAVDRARARWIRRVVDERVATISDRLRSDLQTITSVGGEPVERLRDVLRQILDPEPELVTASASIAPGVDALVEANGSDDRRRQRRRW